jgi:hypothetical protein
MKQDRECEKPTMVQHWAAIIWAARWCDVLYKAPWRKKTCKPVKGHWRISFRKQKLNRILLTACVAKAHAAQLCLVSCEFQVPNATKSECQFRVLCEIQKLWAKKESGTSYCYCYSYCYWRRSVTIISPLAFQCQVMATILPSPSNNKRKNMMCK